MKEKRYQEFEQDLQEILARIENGDYDDLEQLLADHEAGEKLIAELSTRLKDAKAKIIKIVKPKKE